MKEIELTRGKVAVVDDDDYEWLMQWKWQAEKLGRGWFASRSQRIMGAKRKKKIWMHRLIMDASPEIQVGHIDHDNLNNRRLNLRVVNKSQIVSSTAKRSVPCSSKYKGVYFQPKRNKWVAQARTKYLGIFCNEEDAARAYNEYALENYGEFASLNPV